MDVSHAVQSYREYHRLNSKKKLGPAKATSIGVISSAIWHAYTSLESELQVPKVWDFWFFTVGKFVKNSKNWVPRPKIEQRLF
jgi:hypothetical protein